ncbi:MAG TPA: ABC transporter permease [Gemmatimonadaceae bacterium]
MPRDDRPIRSFRLDVGGGRVARDVDEEIAFHLAMRVEKLIAAGWSPAAARAEALRQFGDLPAVRAECLTTDHERERAMRRASYMDDLRRDAAYALRTLRRNKGFAVVLLLILALGIGANTAMFTLVNALLLRTLPVSHPERLVTIGDPRRTGSLSEGTPRPDLASYPVYEDLRDGTRTLAGLYANGRTGRLDVTIGGGHAGTEAEHPRGRLVSGNYFSVLGVPARLGRTFTAAEDRAPGADPVAVISWAYWRRRFGGERSAIGRTITVNGAPLTIIGVTPPGFTGDIVGQPTDIWIPLMMQPSIMPHRTWLTDRTVSWLLLMGRLAPGVTLAQARAELSALERRTLTEHASAADLGGVERGLRETPPRVEPGARGFSYYRSTFARPLLTLMVAVVLVLLVVCANVANLVLARAAARGREMSVRMALGAGRRRLVRQILTESVILAAAGGSLGLLFAIWGSTALLRMAWGAHDTLPLDVHVDARILAFTLGLSLLTALIFGLVPALRATRLDLAGALRAHARSVGGGGGGGAGRERMPLGKLLVVAQVALSMLLLVGTGMLVRSTRRLERADMGAARDRLLIASIDAERSGYAGPRLAALMRDVVARVGRLPGVAGATFSENGIFSGRESGTSVQVESYTARADSDTLIAYDDVGPNYFATIGAHLLRGRDIEARDDESAPRVAVINETMARFFFPRGDALGHQVRSDSVSWEIVGIVRDVQEQGVREPPARRIYFPTVQMHRLPGDFILEVRATGDPARLAGPVRRALRAADPSLVVLDVDPLDDLIRDSISQDRMVANVVTFFGGLALVLAALGLYGVMAYATVRRTSEFGLRMALGAEPGAVTRMVLREAMMLVAAGVIVGLPIALAATRLLRGQLFGVSPLDPPSIGLAVAVLGVSAIVAGWLPAMRASRVPPLDALRSD